MNYHLCINIKGALRNWNSRDWDGCVTGDNGKPITAQEFREHLLDQLSLGRKVIPTCDCDNFDYQTGCRGHKSE